MGRRATAAAATVVIHGEIVRWVRQPLPDSGWHVAELRLETGDLVELVGCYHPRPGCACECEGNYHEHPHYGRQFRVRRCTARTPGTVEGAVRWIQEARVGVGVVKARALVTHFATLAELWECIEHRHTELVSVPGITLTIAEQIHYLYVAEGSDREHQATLRAWGLTQKQIARCVEVWESLEKCVAAIAQNPFELAYQVDYFGFARADEVRKAMGIAHDAPLRIEAGLLFELKSYGDDGNMFGATDFVRETAGGKRLDVSTAQIVAALDRMASDHRLVFDARARAYLPCFADTEDMLTALGRDAISHVAEALDDDAAQQTLH